MVHPNTRWPPEWVEMLEDIYARGYSAATIATHINAEFPCAKLSRNAVIGKIGRMGLQRNECAVREARRRGGGLKPNTPWRTKPKSAWTPKDITPAAPKLAAPKPVVRTPAAPPPPKPRIPAVHVSAITGAIIPGPSPTLPQPVPEPPAATGQPIAIDAITPRTCCWPIDPDGEHGWRYCGDPRDPKSGAGHDRGYCTAHRRKAISRRAA